MAIAVTIAFVFRSEMELTLWNVFCNLSTLQFYGIGGKLFEWYLSFLILLYIAFPFIYKLKDNQKPVIAVGGMTLVVIVFLSITDLSWQYNCAVGRLPIFLLGICCYRKKCNTFHLGLIIFFVAFLLSLPLYYYGYIHTYIILYWCAPMIMLMLSPIIRCLLNTFIGKGLNWLGKHSLEIYVSNVIVMAWLPYFLSYNKFVVYWMMLIAVLPLIYKLNSKLTHYS